MKNSIPLFAILTIPFIASAQSLQTLLPAFVTFLSGVFIPFLLGIGFLIFVINVVRYFIAGSGTEQGREKAKNTALYSILGFVIIVLFWGIINLLASSIGLNDGNSNRPTSDYTNGGGTTNTGGSATSCTQIQIDFDNQFGGPCATN